MVTISKRRAGVVQTFRLEDGHTYWPARTIHFIFIVFVEWRAEDEHSYQWCFHYFYFRLFAFIFKSIFFCSFFLNRWLSTLSETDLSRQFTCILTLSRTGAFETMSEAGKRFVFLFRLRKSSTFGFCAIYIYIYISTLSNGLYLYWLLSGVFSYVFFPSLFFFLPQICCLDPATRYCMTVYCRSPHTVKLFVLTSFVSCCLFCFLFLL